MSGFECGCSEDYGPCEEHGDVLAQREGASLRTSDELALTFIGDALGVGGELSPYGRDVYDQAGEALSDGWVDNGDLADELHELVRQVEASLGYWVTWDDGYRIVRVLPGSPLDV